MCEYGHRCSEVNIQEPYTSIFLGFIFILKLHTCTCVIVYGVGVYGHECKGQGIESYRAGVTGICEVANMIDISEP